MYPQSLRTAFLVQSVAPTGVGTENLLPYQFGIFDTTSWKSLGAPTFSVNKEVVFAVGSPNTGQIPTPKGLRPRNFANVGNVNVSFKSLPVFGHFIDKVYVSKPVKTANPFIGYLGYNGVEGCKSLSLDCGKVYGVDIQVTGGPVRSVFGQDIRELIEIATPCCDSCTDCADTKVATNLWIDALMQKIDESYLVKRFIKAEKVVSCCPAPDPFVTIDFEKYCLTVCDEGDNLALARVQMQYPNKEISRKSRVGTYTTYELIQPIAASAPAAFSIDGVVLADCGTCPSGFTLAAGGDVYIITIENTGAGANAAAWLLEVQAVAAFVTATAAVRTSYQFGTSTYVVTFPAGTSVVAANNTTVSAKVTTTADRCTQDTAITTAWVACGTAYKISRTMCMLRTLSDCNDSDADLAEVSAYYTGMPGIVGSPTVSATDDCKNLYNIVQMNNAYLEDGCDTIATAKFDPVPTYKGSKWEMCACEGWTVDEVTGCPVPPVADTSTCQYGVKFTGAFVDSRTGGCSFDIKDARFYDPIEVYVSLVDTDFPDLCTPAAGADYVISQFPSFEQLSGQEVLREIIKSRFYNQEKYISPSMENAHKYLKAEGLEYGVDVDKHYFAVHLFHNRKMTKNWTSEGNSDREEIVLYIEEDNLLVLDQVLNLLNSYTSSIGIMLPPVAV